MLAMPSRLTCEQALAMLEGQSPVMMSSTAFLANRRSETLWPGKVYEWSAPGRLAIASRAGTAFAPRTACDSVTLGYDNGGRWRAPNSDENATVVLAYASHYGRVSYDLIHLERVFGGGPSLPPAPPLTPGPLYAEYTPYRTWRHIFHASAGLIVLAGFILSISAVRLRYKWLHAAINASSIALLVLSIVLLASAPDDGGSTERRAHVVYGIIVLTLGVGVVLLTRLPRLKARYHAVTGRVVVLGGFGVNVILGSYIFSQIEVLFLAILLEAILCGMVLFKLLD